MLIDSPVLGRRPLQDDRPDSRPEAGPLFAPGGRQRGRARDLGGGRRPPPPPGRGGTRALRGAPLRRLPFSPHALGLHTVQRSRAPRGERQPRPRTLVHWTTRRRKCSGRCSRTNTCTPGTGNIGGPSGSCRESRRTTRSRSTATCCGSTRDSPSTTATSSGRAAACGLPSSTGKTSRSLRPGWTSQAGRSWRPLEDTAVAAQLLYDGRPDWASWRRGVDFYHGERAHLGSRPTRSSGREVRRQEVARRFRARVPRRAGRRAGGKDLQVRGRDRRRSNGGRTLRLERLLRNARAPHCAAGTAWRYRERRLEAGLHRRQTPARSCGRGTVEALRLLVLARNRRAGRGRCGRHGRRRDPRRGAGAARGGRRRRPGDAHRRGQRPALFREGAARRAARARDGKDPIELIVENVEVFKTVKVDYHGGERYPHLERDASKPDLLSAIGKPLAPVGPK